MDQFSRRIVGFGVHAGDVDGTALRRMFNKAVSTQPTPRYLSSDNEPLFLCQRWQANLPILEIREIKSVIHHAELYQFSWRGHCRGLYRLPEAA